MPRLFATASLALLVAGAPIGAVLGQTITPPQAGPGLDTLSSPTPSAAAAGVPGIHSFTVISMTQEQREEFMRHFLASPRRAKLIVVPPLDAQKINPEAARQK